MDSRIQADLYNSTAGQRARQQGSSWARQPASGRAGALRENSSETVSLHSVRKRASFFGRSNSDASSLRRAPAPGHAAKLSLGAVRTEEDGARPVTSTSSDMRRRKTDPIQSIRDSIFGGKKKGAKDVAEAPNSRPGSKGAGSALNDAPAPASSFSSEEDYYRHLRKYSISPPFNFQHVTHTARNQLPQLETVDEKDLPGQFWSVAAIQRPRRRVHGIKVDDLDPKHRQMGLIRESPEPSPAFSPPVSPPRAVSPPQPSTLTIPQQNPGSELRLISPISPISPLESSLPDTLPEQVPPSQQTAESLSSSNTPRASDTRTTRHPKRHSSLGVLNQQFQSNLQGPVELPADSGLRSQESFYDSNSSSSENDAGNASPPRETRPREPAEPVLNASMPPNFSRDYDVAFRSRQPLPPLPAQSVGASTSSPELLRVNSVFPASMLSPTLPRAKPTSPKSKRSSRSSRSARRSPAVSTSSADIRNPSLPSLFSVSDVSWEDSIDLAYEEEAEATCDFAWSGRQQTQNSATRKSDNSKRDSAATVYHADSPAASNASESAVSLHRNSSTDTIADRRPSVGPHKRGTSVGHRGFLAARKNSSTPDLLAKAKDSPAPLSFSQASTQVSVLSPVFSVADEDAQKTPFAPAELHYPYIERVSNDYLSDPESYRNSHSSKHRKSSSYGSYGSYDSAGTRPGNPSTTNPNTTRWSIASSGSSVPELMHSRPKSKSSLSRSVTSQPLETLPQSPPDSGTEAEFGAMPPPPQPRSEMPRNTFVMRTSGESSDRVMQAAGRAVQRGRPGSYARYSQHLEPQAVPRGGVRESWVQGPEWL